MTEVNSVASTVLTSLDIGSGLDIAKLSQDLTDAEKVPKQEVIQGDIDATEASISTYGLVKFQVDALKTAFEKLNDANELATSAGTSSDVTKLTVASVAGSATAGAYDFTVSQLAQNQRVMSDQYTTTTQALNSGSGFDISLSVGTTKSAIPAVYSATVTAAETTTLVVGDGTTSVTVASASYSTIDQQVSAIQGGTNYSSLLFTVSKNTAGNAIEFTYKSAGAVASTPTFTGSGSTHTVTNPTVGVSVSSPVNGVAAEYNVTATASETTALVASDGSNSVSVNSASYSSIADQVTAIQGATGYSDLLFTVGLNSAEDGFTFTYKTTAAISTAPTLTGTGSSHSVTSTITGVTPVNAATTTTINVATDTPAGIVSAINAANTGVTATLVDTGTAGNNYRIVLAGQTGSNGVFTLTSSPDLGFHDTANALQTAQDSVMNFEGLDITRSSNDISDVIDGATINLVSTTSTAVRLNITNDKSTLKTNLQGMVDTYNGLNTLFTTATSTTSESELGGSLADDTSMVRFLKDQIRTSIFADSSTKSGNISAMRDLGISVDKSGTMTFTAATYDAAVLASYDDIVTMLTADTSNESLFTTSSKGLSQDIATALEAFTDSDGIVTTRSTNATTALADHKEELTKLEARMESVYQRYLTQFTAMESLMASMDATKDYLTGQLESLSKAYDS
tara:strand:- start:2061 stop:4109 length:2049 start_codon:yes stop_codon:yes gene_type:complete